MKIVAADNCVIVFFHLCSRGPEASGGSCIVALLAPAVNSIRARPTMTITAHL